MSEQAPFRRGDTAGVVAPPPLIALATVLAGLALDWLLPAYLLGALFSLSTRIFFGALLALAGVWLAVVAEREFRRAGTEVKPWRPSLALALGGPYEWLRNPMYVGLALLVGGIGIAFASDWTIVLMLPSAIVMHYGVVLREERYLEDKFGDAYREYKARVPRYGWPL